jgi:hypothetical protein
MTRAWRGFFAVCFGLAGLLSVVLGSVSETASSLDLCFRSRVTVLSPYLSDRESKELLASRVTMKNRADFEAITTRLEEYARKHDVSPVVESLKRNNPARCF